MPLCGAVAASHRPRLRRVAEPFDETTALWKLIARHCRLRFPTWTARVLSALLVGGVAAALIAPNFIRTCNRGPLTACKSNLKNLATALELYASDHGGEYPVEFKQMMAGNYLKAVPTCPEAGFLTYSYRRTGTGKQAGFFMQCCGRHHAQAYSAFPKSPHNYPRYSSETGLGDHP